jgi:hypothetical protein
METEAEAKPEEPTEAGEVEPKKPTGPRERLKALVAEYGKVAIFVYIAIYLLVIVGSATAILLGFDVESSAGGAGLFLSVYAVTRVTLPIRIGATVVLTPIVARALRRPRGPKAEEAPAASEEDPAEAAPTQPSSHPEPS